MATATYAIALGSNRRGRHGAPAQSIAAALQAIGEVIAAAPIITSPPMGPSRRRYANTTALVASDEAPPVLLARLKAIERAFGRRRGRRWGDRVIDLDIVLWSDGAWTSPHLTIPHPGYRQRIFVLAPLARIAPGWRDPRTGFTVAHALARLTARRPVPRSRDRR